MSEADASQSPWGTREERIALFQKELTRADPAVWALVQHSNVAVIDYEVDDDREAYTRLNGLVVTIPTELYQWYADNHEAVERVVWRAAQAVWSVDKVRSQGTLFFEESLTPPPLLADFLASASGVQRPRPSRFNSAVVPMSERDGVAWLTPPEAKLYDVLKDTGWLFVPQPSFLAGDTLDKRPDFCIFWNDKAAQPILVEIDSDSYHPPSQRDADEAKERIFQSRGFHYIRFSAKKVLAEPLNVIKEIRAFGERLWGAGQ